MKVDKMEMMMKKTVTIPETLQKHLFPKMELAFTVKEERVVDVMNHKRIFIEPNEIEKLKKYSTPKYQTTELVYNACLSDQKQVTIIEKKITNTCEIIYFENGIVAYKERFGGKDDKEPDMIDMLV